MHNTETSAVQEFTVSALFEPWGYICQNRFLGGVLLMFDLPGVVIKTGFY